jgi:hypothetical protein
VNRKVRSLLLFGCILVVAMATVASASAGGKGSFEPKVGTYSGTYTGSQGPVSTTGTVTKSGGKFVVQPMVGGTAECTDGSILNGVPLALAPPVQGKAFSLTQKVTGRTPEGTGTYVVKMSGRFSGEKAFSGTVSGESLPVNPAVVNSPTCSTGTVHFSLKYK